MSNFNLNKDPWLSNEFQMVLFDKEKKFPNPEEAKEKFSPWHKELGGKLYNKEKGQFSVKNLKDFYFFMKLHPLLDQKGKKDLQAIKKNDKLNLLRYVSFCYLILVPYTYYYYSRKSGNIHNFIRNNKLLLFRKFVVSYIGLVCFYHSVLRKILFNRALNKNKNFKQTYFVDYI